jgi:WD40 repeat protein
VAIAPDGTWLATASRDRTARIWDAATGQQRATLTGHTSSVIAVAIAPDGTWLATASRDRTARIWDIRTGRQRATLTGHTSWVQAVAIAPDGTWLATVGGDGTARIWDAATGAARALIRVDGSLGDCAWSLSGSTLAAVGNTGLYLFTFKP